MLKAYNAEEAIAKVKKSLDSANSWSKKTDGRFGDIETIRTKHKELIDIITEIQQRYNCDIKFFFSKKTIRPLGFIPIEELIHTWTYAERIYILMDDAAGEFFNVYIRI